MNTNQTSTRMTLAALAALALAGVLPHAAWADGDKDKGKKKTVIIGTPTITPDNPPKKK